MGIETGRVVRIVEDERSAIFLGIDRGSGDQVGRDWQGGPSRHRPTEECAPVQLQFAQSGEIRFSAPGH
jgi:hypothetical protein